MTKGITSGQPRDAAGKRNATAIPIMENISAGIKTTEAAEMTNSPCFIRILKKGLRERAFFMLFFGSAEIE